MQVSIARQLSLQPTTVGNFFMNARRRLQDKWKEGDYDMGGYDDTTGDPDPEGEVNQDDYSERNQITINQELLVPELIQQHLTQPSQQSGSTPPPLIKNSGSTISDGYISILGGMIV